MRDALPPNGPRKGRESAIINLSKSVEPGSHWVAYYKDGKCVDYFDSFGNLQPPPELVDYFGSGSVIRFNHTRYQKNPKKLV